MLLYKHSVSDSASLAVPCIADASAIWAGRRVAHSLWHEQDLEEDAEHVLNWQVGFAVRQSLQQIHQRPVLLTMTKLVSHL